MKTIIVTGAAGNLAAAVLKVFLEKGYRVLATVLAGGSPSANAHPNLLVHAVDASQPEAVRNFVEEMTKEHGSLDGLIHLVGGYAGGRLTDTTPQAMHSMLALNFDTAFHYVQPVMTQMMEQKAGGKIILVGSRPGMHPSAAQTAVAYGLSKSLIFRLAELINLEGRDKSISATVIVPGTIDTPANRKSMPKADFSRWNPPEEIAARMEEVFSGIEKATVIEFPV